jgi:hypothetical protein
MFTESFNGDDVMPLGLGSEQRTRVDRFAIEQNCVRAGEALFVAKFDTEETKSTNSS